MADTVKAALAVEDTAARERAFRVARAKAYHVARTRAWRERQRDGLRCFALEVRDTEVDALVQLGLLDDAKRYEHQAILAALYDFLDRTLDADDWLLASRRQFQGFSWS
jgi:hypothetical protein